MDTALQIAAVVLGLAALVWSADRFVDGASATARLLGVPPLLVGMVVVGFGTSAPELTVSAFAAAGGNPSIALGNAFGSNICNIALILGVCAAIRATPFGRPAVVRETPLLLLATALAGFCLHDDALTRAESFLMLGAFAALLAVSSVAGVRERRAGGGENAGSPAPAPTSPAAAAWRLAIGLAGLVLSSKALVWGAVGVARALGVSDLLVGLTVVAVGTSLPELASSVAAARKGESDIAVGNVIGSNLFNTLAVTGLAGAIAPIADVPEAVRTRDLPVTAAFTAALFLFGLVPLLRRRPASLRRWQGALLLLGYLAYTAWLVRSETGGA